MDRQLGRVERFLKLGYCHGDIVRVLESLHHDAQTNDILEELIKTCRTTTGGRPAHPSPQLIPRGCSPPQTSPNSSLSQPIRPSTATDKDSTGGFRPVVIDGSNVAMSHGNKKVFSCRGLQLAVRWFLDRGVRDITVFVPLWRKEQPRPEAPITDQHLLHELEKKKILVFTPSRCVNGKRVVCYDDRYIIKLAYDSDGIIVSNDNYRDLQIEKPQWKKFIEERLLMYSFVNDKFMPPDDPLGRNGPTIDNFLRKKPWSLESKQQHCPYGKKCTYGVKCKFYHPERSNQSQLSVADELRAKSKSPAEREHLCPAHQETHVAYTASYHEPDHAAPPYRYPSTPPPPARIEEPHSHRSSPSELFSQQSEAGSPALLRPPAIRFCPSPDTDEAFGSLEGSLSRLFVQDSGGDGGTQASYTYSSGVAGCSRASGDFYSSNHYSGGHNNAQWLGLAAPPSSGGCHAHERLCLCGYDRPHACESPACGQCRYGQQRQAQQPPPGRCSSYHGPPPGDGSPVLYYQRGPSARQCYSLPDYAWGRGSWPDGRDNGSPSEEERRNVSDQLSALFPQSAVEHVMRRYPHTLDVSQLIPLIHKYRTSHVTF